MTEQSELTYPPKEINLPFGLSLSFKKVTGGRWNLNREKPETKGTYVVTTESSPDGFSQIFYNFRGNTKLGVGLVFPIKSSTPLKPDGTFDAKRYMKIEVEELIEQSLERESKISFGRLRKNGDIIEGLDLISIRFRK